MSSNPADAIVRHILTAEIMHQSNNSRLCEKVGLFVLDSWAHRTLAFTSETFRLTYSLPNFHFHAVTAYNILRARAPPLGCTATEAGAEWGLAPIRMTYPFVVGA